MAVCRISASAGLADFCAADKTQPTELFDNRCGVASGGMGLSGFLRRAERGDAGVLVRRSEVSSVLRVDRAAAPSQSAGIGASTDPQLPAKLHKVPSMVFDLELDDCDDGPQGIEDSSVLQSDSRLTTLLKLQTADEQMLYDDVQRLWEQQTREAVNEDNLNPLALDLQSLGYTVGIRKAVGGGVGGECLRNLRHSFLRVSLPGQRRVYIVDPCFRDQFDLHRPTREYLHLFETLPKVFVALEDCVARVVNLMCTEMLQVFKQSGTTMPPWRRATSMITKWLPRKSMDERPMPLRSKISLSSEYESDGPICGSRRATPFGGLRIKAVRNLAEMAASEDEASLK